MRKEIKKASTIRFQGFTDDWEQRKLSDVAERVTRKNKNLESTLPLTISAQYGLIDQNEFFDKRIASKDVSGYYLIRKGEFAYNKSTSNDAPWGAIKRLNRYESGVLSTLYIVFCILDKSKTCSDYLASYYDTNLWHKEVKNIAAEGARNHGLLNIAPADFFETKLMIPKNFEEQQMIGEYFSNLDNLIILHQRKLDQLKKLKKYFLQNMFPAKGEKVPRIRFKGFTGDWEERKLGECAPIRGGFAFESKKFVNSGVPIIRISNILGDGNVGGEFTYYDEQNNDSQYILPDKALIMAMSGATTGKVGILDNPNNLKYYQNQRVGYFLQNDEYDYKFIGTFLRSNLFQNQLKEVLVSGAQPNISGNDINKLIINISVSLAEQKQIGRIMELFDEIIAIHHRRLDQLQTMKKYMLQNLFI